MLPFTFFFLVLEDTSGSRRVIPAGIPKKSENHFFFLQQCGDYGGGRLVVSGHLAAAGNEINAVEQQQLLRRVFTFFFCSWTKLPGNPRWIRRCKSILIIQSNCLSFLTQSVRMQGALFFIYFQNNTTISPLKHNRVWIRPAYAPLQLSSFCTYMRRRLDFFEDLD